MGCGVPASAADYASRRASADKKSVTSLAISVQYAGDGSGVG
jgi:hypothetical protein